MISNIISIFRSGMSLQDKVLYIVFFAVCILFSLILHECAHGWVALKCGDPTAKWLGRLTLDPRKHLDPVGTLCMLFLRIGWAKPVPINPNNFRHYRRDYVLVSFAGIAMNLLIYLVSTFFAVVAEKNMTAMWVVYVYSFLTMLAQMNLCLAVFNLLPVPPLDGFKLLDLLVFRGSLTFSRQTMQLIQFGFLAVCLSGLLNGMLTKVITAIDGVVFSFFESVL